MVYKMNFLKSKAKICQVSDKWFEGNPDVYFRDE